MNSVLNELFQIINERKNEPTANSHTSYLFEKGLDKILKKCGEECTEVIIAAKNNDNEELKNEVADLIFHIMVLCAERNLNWWEVEEVLQERSRKKGNLKQFHNTENDML